MYKFSFKIKHKHCYETALSTVFPKHHITVVDIQSRNPKEKQYFYYITGDQQQFDAIIAHLRLSKGYRLTKEIERANDTLLLLVVLHQQGYVQNSIQKHHGFFLEPHTVYSGFEYWHVGLVDHSAIAPLRKELMKAGKVTTLFIGKVEFAHQLLSKQQKRIFLYAFEQGYYELPRKTTMERIAKALRLNHSTVGEHLLKAENKVINSIARRL